MRKPILWITLSLFFLMACEGELGPNLGPMSDLETPIESGPIAVDTLPPEEASSDEAEPDEATNDSMAATDTGATPVPAPVTVLVTDTVAAPVQDTPEPLAVPGATATLIAPIEVETQCEIDISIDLAGYANLEEELGCPLNQAITDPIAINEFGPGPDFDRFMLWLSHEQQIYVLFVEGGWQAYADSWTDDMPIFACNPMAEEPTSPPLPRRGFGKVWCDHENVRQNLGLIIREERLCQHAALQSFERGRMLACYEDDTVRYFMLLNDGTWRVEFVQY